MPTVTLRVPLFYYAAHLPLFCDIAANIFTTTHIGIHKQFHPLAVALTADTAGYLLLCVAHSVIVNLFGKCHAVCLLLISALRLLWSICIANCACCS